MAAGSEPDGGEAGFSVTCRCECRSCEWCRVSRDSDDSDYENVSVRAQRHKTTTMYQRRVVIDIGGQKFATLGSTLARDTATKLGRLTTSDPAYDRHRGEYFYDRNPRLFANILDFYRTGELHLPQDVCGPFIKRELDFWEISESVIAPCCLKNYKEYEEEQRSLELLESMFDGKERPETPESRSGRSRQRQTFCAKWMKNIWTFLEFPATSLAAKVWAYFYLVLLVCSIAVICMETHPDFRVTSRTRFRCPVLTEPEIGNDSTPAGNATVRSVLAPRRILLGEQNPKVRMYITTDPHPALALTDDICTVIFTLELLIRFVVWPNKLRFFRSFFNVIDIMAVVPMFIVSTSARLTPCFWIQRGFLSSYLVMSFVCVFRAVRILKLIKHCRGLQIMYLAMKASLKEILLLLLLIVIGTLIFSTMIYYAEFSDEDSFANIPIGFWWSIVTMTTVGYGDITPKTGLGYLVGCLCALTGMLITGLPIPVIANSFHLYYTYAKLKDKLQIQKRLGHREATKTTVAGPNALSSDVHENGYSRTKTNRYHMIESTRISSFTHM